MLFSVFAYSLRRFEYLVIGQPFRGGAFVTVHPVGLIVGDFLEFIAELCKLTRPSKDCIIFVFPWCIL